MIRYLLSLAFVVPLCGAEKKTPENVVKHLQRVYDKGLRQFRFRAGYPGGLEKWRRDWRPVLHRLVGLDRIEKLNKGFRPRLRFGKELDFGEFTRQKGDIETEPHVRIPFWLFRPKGDGPFPLALTPHGHDGIGHDTSAGVYQDAKHKERTLAGDRDVAVQAVKRGFVAIAPAVRGFRWMVFPMSTNGTTDGIAGVN